MSIWQRILTFLRRLLGIKPTPPIEEPTDPTPEEPQQPEQPTDPEQPQEPDDPDVDEPEPPAQPIVFMPRPDSFTTWNLMQDPLASKGYALQALHAGDGDLTALERVIIDAGLWTLWVRVFGADSRSDAFYAGVQGHIIHRRYPGVHGRYQWVMVDMYDLEAGPHWVGVGNGEAGLRYDCMVLDPSGLSVAELNVLVGAPPHVDPQPDPPVEPDPSPPPPPGLGDLTHKIAPVINPSFDASRPTLRTGEELTPEQSYYHDAALRALLRSDPSTYTSIRVRFANPDSYVLGRFGEPIQVPSIMVMSRTGDGRHLDALTVGWNLAYNTLVIEWDPANINLKDGFIADLAGARIVGGKWALTTGKTPWSPYRKWLYSGNNGTAGAGTDLNNLQTIKPWAILAQYLWALEVNRNTPSNAGYDYGAEADKWRPIIRGFIDAYTLATDEPWAKSLKGLDGGMRLDGKLLFGGSRTRAKPGQWPFFVRDEGHAIYNSALFCYYAGLLGTLAGWDIPNPSDALHAADLLMRYIRSQMIDSRDSMGRPSIILKGGAEHSAMKATYTAYAALELAHIRDIGRWDQHFDDETLLRISRSYTDMIKSDGSTLGDLASEIDRTGHGLQVGHGSPRTPYQNAINGFSTPLLWAESEHLFRSATAAQVTREAGGYGEGAKTHILPAIQFVREVRR